MPHLSPRLLMDLCLLGMPGTGKMSREEAMSAYISEMKLVAQKVVRAVVLCP